MLRKCNNSDNVTIQKINLTCPGKIKIDNLKESLDKLRAFYSIFAVPLILDFVQVQVIILHDNWRLRQTTCAFLLFIHE